VIFEDLQWADRGTLDVLRHLAGTIVDLPVMIVAPAATTRRSPSMRWQTSCAFRWRGSMQQRSRH